MIVYSHRRSGTHLLMNYLKMCFGIDARKFHLEPNKETRQQHQVVYIIRDGRDTLTSCYYWWKTSGESRVCHIQEAFDTLSFSDYLRGIEVPTFTPHISPNGETNVKSIEVERGMFKTPISFWKQHVLSAHDKYPVVRYEDLLSDPVETITSLGRAMQLKVRRKPKPITKLVGHHPRKGKIGDHKNHFTEEDQTLFNEIAGDLLGVYGYE